jgi:hypothetical protein
MLKSFIATDFGVDKIALLISLGDGRRFRIEAEIIKIRDDMQQNLQTGSLKPLSYCGGINLV